MQAKVEDNQITNTTHPRLYGGKDSCIYPGSVVKKPVEKIHVTCKAWNYATDTIALSHTKSTQTDGRSVRSCMPQ